MVTFLGGGGGGAGTHSWLVGPAHCAVTTVLCLCPPPLRLGSVYIVTWVVSTMRSYCPSEFKHSRTCGSFTNYRVDSHSI